MTTKTKHQSIDPSALMGDLLRSLLPRLHGGVSHRCYSNPEAKNRKLDADVAASFEMSRRRDNLSWSHHFTALGADDPVSALETAVEQRLTSSIRGYLLQTTLSKSSNMT